MAKITYEFDTCAENFNEHELWEIQNADKMWLALAKLREEFRSWYKYRTDKIPQEEAYEFFCNTICEAGLKNDDFI